MIYAQLEDGTLLPADAGVFPEWSISEDFGFAAGGVLSSVTYWGGSRGRAVHYNILKVCIRCCLHEISFEYFVRRRDGPLAGRWSTDATSGVSRSAKNSKSTVQWQIQGLKRSLFLFPFGVLYLYITNLKTPVFTFLIHNRTDLGSLKIFVILFAHIKLFWWNLRRLCNVTLLPLKARDHVQSDLGLR